MKAYGKDYENTSKVLVTVEVEYIPELCHPDELDWPELETVTGPGFKFRHVSTVAVPKSVT